MLMITRNALYALRLAALVALVVGCAPSGNSQQTGMTQSVAASAKSPEAASGQASEPSAPASQVEPSPNGQSESKQDGDKKQRRPENPNRIYQLDELEVVKIKIGKHVFKAWVMDTMSKQQEGLMHVTDAEIAADEAMIFVYNEPRELGFWMRNTRIPLDIAYVDAKNVILNIAQMKPFDETLVRSRGEAKYAIEFKKGTLSKIGVKAGMKFEIPPGLVNKDGE